MQIEAGKAPPRSRWRRWYFLGLLVFIYIALSIDKTVISVLVEPLKAEFGLSDSQLGLLSGLAFTLPYGIAVMPMGWLVDRFNRRNILAINLSVWSVLTSISGFATSFAMLAGARIGVGATESGAHPASLSLIADTFPRNLRSTATSIYYSGAAAGQIFAFLLGGWVLLQFGWRWVFLVAGVPGLVLALLLVTTIKEPVRGATDEGKIAPATAEGTSAIAVLGRIWRSPPLLHAIMGNMISVSVQQSLNVWIISFLVRIHHVTVPQAALWAGLGIGVVMTVGALIIGPIADKVSGGVPARLALIPTIGAFAAAAAGVAMALAPSLATALVAMSLTALLAGFFLGPSLALILSLAPSDVRGSSVAFAKLATVAVGNAAVTFFTGAMSDLIGGDEAIRWAVFFTVLLHIWAGFHYLRCSRLA